MQIRPMGGHDVKIMHIAPSRYQWHKFKDYLHFYVMLGAIPISIIIFCANVFIGPATLEPIPEGYRPKHWEYFRHPIQRFIARHLTTIPQQDYERSMHFMYEQEERVALRRLEKKIRALMAEREDYQAYYYTPMTAKYHRVSRDAAEWLKDHWAQ